MMMHLKCDHSISESINIKICLLMQSIVGPDNQSSCLHIKFTDKQKHNNIYSEIHVESDQFFMQISHIQGPVHFDENGVRDVTKLSLRVLQYWTSCIKKETSCGRINLVEVAYVNKDGKSLHFKEGDRNKIWPGYCR